MGNCAIKPKVLKDSDEDLVPVERETPAPAENSVNNAPSAVEEAAAAARRNEKGKEILIEDDVDEHKRPSLSHLFHEGKILVEKEVTDLSPVRPDTNSKTGTSDLMAYYVKEPEECVTFDVQTRNDLEVKIPKDSQVKTPETPEAKEAEESNFSDNWEVKIPKDFQVKSPETPKAKEAEESEVNFSENWEVKFPEELEATKPSEVVKVAEVSDEVSAPELSQVKVTKESDVPDVLEDKNIPEAPQLSHEVKVTKESDVPQVLEDKNIPDVSEVEAAESELLKVSEVTSPEDLEIEVPEVFEVKTHETSNVKVTEVKIDQEPVKAKIEVPEFVDAKEKIDKSDHDK